MSVDVKMPQLGVAMTEGIISKWLKREGDPVVKGDPLLEVETDKVTTEVESPSSGILSHIVAQEGAIVPVFQAIAIIAEPGEKAETTLFDVRISSDQSGSAPPSPDAASLAGSADTASPTSSRSRVLVSPRARKMAQETGLDLARVRGTGPGGRIMEKDIDRALSELTREPDRPAATQPTTRSQGFTLMAPTTASAAQPQTIPFGKPSPGEGRSIPLAGMRKLIAERMSQSQNVTAQVTISAEVDMSEASKLRDQANSEWARQDLGKLSYTDIVVKAVARALMQHPRINSSLVEGVILEHAAINVGVAVALEEGLMVPVIHDAPSKSLLEISRTSRDLIDRARLNQVTIDELQGGTFTVTNMGMLGVEMFTPIINWPECAILGVGRIAERVVARDGQAVVRPTMWLSLTFDHRVVDGAPAAAFLARVAQLLESPYLLFV